MTLDEAVASVLFHLPGMSEDRLLTYTPAQVFWWYGQAMKNHAMDRLSQMTDHVATFGPMVARKDAKLDAFVEEHRANLAKVAGLATRRNP